MTTTYKNIYSFYSDTDPQPFWNFVNNVRGGKKSNIPNEVYLDDGETISTDPEQILKRLERDLGSLLAPPSMNE